MGDNNCNYADERLDLVLERASRDPLQVHVIVTALDNPDTPVLIELRENVQQLKLDREERISIKARRTRN